MRFDIQNIFGQFAVDGGLAEQSVIASGHINDTFLIRTDNGSSYVLQRINHTVFEDPKRVMENKILVSKHIESKLAAISDDERQRRMLTFCPTRSGEFLCRDNDGNFWNMMLYIKDSMVYAKTPSPNIAFEAGRAFGGFLAQTADLDPSLLYQTMDGFHSMSRRFSQFDEAVENASKERLAEASELLDTAEGLRTEMQQLEERVKTGEIPFRVTHNDTKISNALFSDEGEALCVIDLDTVMRGVVHYDFGDAVRTICGSADEDEPDIDKVEFNIDYYRSFVGGFIGASGITLSKSEIEGLALSAKVMTFIIGLRFLTDFLNNDVYFDTKYDRHNFVRARNQFRFANLIDKQLHLMQEIVESEIEMSLLKNGMQA